MHVVAEIRLDYSEARHSREEHDFHRDGDQLDISGSFTYLETLQTSSYRFRTVVNPEYALSWQYAPSRRSKPAGAISFDVPVSATEGPSHLFRQYTTNATFGLALDGYLPQTDWKRVTEHVLASPDVHVQGEENLNGTPCKIIKGTNQYGVMSLWLAPEQGCVLRKLAYTKGPDDLPRPGDPYYMVWGPNITRQAWSFVVDNVDVARIGDTFVPIKGHARETFELSDHSRKVGDVEYTRTKISLGPPDRAGGLFSMTDLPEGAKIYRQEEKYRSSPVRYCWRGGKITEVTADAPAVVDLSPIPTPEHSTSRLVLWMAGPSLGICLGTVVFYRRSRRGSRR